MTKLRKHDVQKEGTRVSEAFAYSRLKRNPWKLVILDFNVKPMTIECFTSLVMHSTSIIQISEAMSLDINST